MSLLVELLVGLVPDALVSSCDRARDRRLLAESRARCGLRAVRGRILNIGTEWSAGTCTISTGQLHFVPTIGIVGDRRIGVLDILASNVDPDEDVNLGQGQTRTYVLRTEAGDLYWAVPDAIAEQARTLLLPATVELRGYPDQDHAG